MTNKEILNEVQSLLNIANGFSQSGQKIFNLPIDNEFIIQFGKALKHIVERHIPQKLIATEEYSNGCCPNCKEHIAWIRAELLDDMTNCPYCGQVIIDWSDEQ